MYICICRNPEPYPPKPHTQHHPPHPIFGSSFERPSGEKHVRKTQPNKNCHLWWTLFCWEIYFEIEPALNPIRHGGKATICWTYLLWHQACTVTALIAWRFNSAINRDRTLSNTQISHRNRKDAQRPFGAGYTPTQQINPRSFFWTCFVPKRRFGGKPVV